MLQARYLGRVLLCSSNIFKQLTYALDGAPIERFNGKVQLVLNAASRAILDPKRMVHVAFAAQSALDASLLLDLIQGVGYVL